MPDFFISYTSTDESWAEWIAWTLEEFRFEVVLQKWDFVVGSNFVLEMQRAASKAKRTIAVLSPDYLSASQFGPSEWAAAFSSDPEGLMRTLLPVRVRECAADGLLKSIVHADLVGLDLEAAKRQLLDCARGGRRKPERAPPFPGVISQTNREQAVPEQRSAQNANTSHPPYISETQRPISATATRLVHDDFPAFLKRINLQDVREISVCAYTGSRTIKDLCKLIEGEEHPPNLKLNILLHSPILSDKKRANDVATTIATVKSLVANAPSILSAIRYYSAPPLLRSVIFENNNGTSDAFIAYYDWQPANKSIRRPTSNEEATYFLSSTSDSALYNVHQSWFKHYWGQRKIHTLVFDFDDTLFFTTEIRARAWASSIQWAVANSIISSEDLTEEFKSALQDGTLGKTLVEIVLEEQEEAAIVKRLFDVKLHSPYYAPHLKELLARRSELRNAETAKAKPIGSVVSALGALTKNYQLIVLTATSESLVQSVLKENGISGFSFIFGREAPLYSWDAIHFKAQGLLRVSALLGVPLERMIFVGDSKGDYHASRQLGVQFIEIRTNARRFERESVIFSDPSEYSLVVEKSGELLRIIKKIEDDLIEPLA